MGKYVESNLGRNEEIILSAHRTGFYLVSAWIKGILFCWLLLIPTIKAIIATVRYNSCELAITNKRVIGKIGVVKTQTLDTPLNKVQSATTASGFWGKVFGFGTVTISSAAGSIAFVGIKKPEEFKGKLMNQIEEYEQDRMKEQAAQMASAMAGALNK